VNRSLMLAGLLIVLFGVYWFVNKSEPVAQTNVPLVNADSASVSFMKIVTATDTVELRKEGDGWKVSGAKPYPANSQNVGRALQKFAQMTRKAVVTDKPDRYAEFEVDGAKGVQVVVTSGGKEQTLILGKPSPSMQTSYARVEGDKEVWEIGGNHASTFRRPRADWRDKTITTLPMDSIRKVTITFPTEQVVLSKVDTTWSGTMNGTPFTAAKSQIERVTRLLSKMSAVEFSDTLSDAAFSTPECTVLAEMSDGSSTELKLVKRDDKQYFLRKSGALSDFVIYNSTAEVLMKKPDDLIEKPKPAS
jgi:hypothetical protein